MKAVAIVSGGLDSVVLSYHLKSLGYDLVILSFNYGQRHSKELKFSKKISKKLNADYTLIDLKDLSKVLKGSALTDSIEVPDGNYAEQSMKITVVPNRNAIMLSIAYAAAVSYNADIVSTAVHAGDHFIYPDCRPEFTEAFAAMQLHATRGFAKDNLSLYTPFINMTKAEIVKLGHSLNVPFEDTWSCYKGGDVHCGTCGTCTERREAFVLNNLADPTEYLN